MKGNTQLRPFAQPPDNCLTPRPSLFHNSQQGAPPMSYTIDRSFPNASFQEIVERTRAALAKQGFGVLTEIDVKATLHKKIGAQVDDYLILGACNPQMAHQAMKIEPRVGAMLPCNVIVRSIENGAVEVSAIDPVASMMGIDNVGLKEVASGVRTMLSDVVADI
jgi:uncharacterized protein (DUF302 family)